MTPHIIGRRSSLFTRVVLIVAEELGVEYEIVPIPDMTATDPTAYGNHPALKLPVLKRDDSSLFGTMNICRALVEQSKSFTGRIVWPEDLHDDLSRNAQELVWHCMSAQVQLVMGTVVGGLPPDNIFFAKTRVGIHNSLQWLDDHLDRALQRLPQPRAFSIFEVSLLCLVDHLAWRKTLDIEPYTALRTFARTYGVRPSATNTAYRFDAAS